MPDDESCPQCAKCGRACPGPTLHEPEPDYEAQDSVWAISDLVLSPNGLPSYVTVVHHGDDAVKAMDAEEALRYCATVMEAASRAEYDQALYAQLAEMYKDPLAALEDVEHLRDDRPPLDNAATLPFTFTPIVASKTTQGAVEVRVNGEQISLWTLVDVRQHALHVMDVAMGVHMDGAYYRFLLQRLGLESELARRMVYELRRWRPKGDAGGYQDRRAPVPTGPKLFPLRRPVRPVPGLSPLGLPVDPPPWNGSGTPPQQRGGGKGKRRRR